MKSCKVAIVGAGVVGASVFHRMSQAWGEGVLLMEKTRVGDGATGFSGGILRCFHLDAALSDACVTGLRFYQQLARDRTDFRIEPSGFVHLVPEVKAQEARREFERLGRHVPLQWFSAAEARDRFGLADTGGVACAVYEPEAGYVNPLKASEILLSLGQQRGACAVAGVELQSIRQCSAGLRLQTNAGEVRCEVLVLCTGAWTPMLTFRLGLEMPVTLRSKAIQVNRVERAPGVAVTAFLDHATGAYGRPDGAAFTFVGSPVEQWDVDPDRMEAPYAGACEDAIARAATRFEWMNHAQPMGGYRRFDAYEDSGRGLVGWCGPVPGVLVAAGFSGNGIKLAPTAAEHVGALVDLVLSGQERPA